MADSLANEAKTLEPLTSSTTVFDANSVAKQKLCSNPRKKLSLPELNYSREMTATITRLKTKMVQRAQKLDNCQWSRVLFTDESRFSTRSELQRVLIWRETWTRFYTSNIKKRHHYGGPGVLVWGGIMLNGRTELHIFDRGSVIGDRYCEEVLLPHVRMFRGAIDPDFIFMDDNERPHRTLAVEELLESEDITRMDWPAYSPDLNPIEHVWDALGRRISARLHHPENTQQLKQMLIEEWALLPQEMLHQLVLIRRRRCETTIALLNQRTGTAKGSAAESYIYAQNPQLWQHIQKYGFADLEEGLDKLRRGELGVLIGDTVVLDYFRGNDPGCSLQLLGQSIFDDAYAVGMQKGFRLKPFDMERSPAGKFHFQLRKQTPYMGATDPQLCSDSLPEKSISTLILRYNEYGLMEQLQKKWFGRVPCFNHSVHRLNKPQPLSLRSVAGVFLMLLLGGAVGVLILFIEHAVFKHALPELRKKPQECFWKSPNVMFFSQLEKGRSVTSVAAEFVIAHSIVSRLWRQFQTTGTAIREFSSGRPRGTTPADDRYIVLQARRNRRQTAGEIARHTTQATGRPISRFTVARRLHGGGLFARRPVRRFSLSSDFHRILIWRERGSRNHPSNIIERDRYGGRGVLVWGGIMLGSRTDLHIFDACSVNGTRYCNEILLPYVRLFRGAMGLQFLFMDDNAPCHRTVAAEQLLESEDIEGMDWSARSPDLNPIEHVWDFLGRRLAARTLPPVTIRELRLALQDEWAAMPQQLIDTLILSMGRRCETCLAVR
ncbi:transposable element Tcb2 transposase [Trichonephila clavipes]|nr:transposable element Tcb2 transposase [Trichonephila clavipes]